MFTTLAPWTGDPFMMPAAEPVPASPATGRLRRWSFTIGRDGLSISSTTEDYRPRVVAPTALPRSTATLTVAALAGGLALLLVGASAGRAWSPAPPIADAAMIVPAARPVATPTATLKATPDRSAAIGRAFPTALPTPVAEDDAVRAPGLSRAEAIQRALGTGEFQEWAGSDGNTGFAVAGPAEVTPHGSCRALAVLTRKTDGSDSVASSRECQAPTEAKQP